MSRITIWYSLLVILVFAAGIFIRVKNFPDIPPGFNQDEAGSAYESYSLYKTGKDKWGNQLPAYFPSWGSGQNVLQAYLSIPVINHYGLSLFSARLVPLIIGVCTLPLLFFCLLPLGRTAALMALFLISVSPWHFMLSRWSLESNLLPFFMLLGCTFLSKAFITQKKKWIIPSLIPFAIALYAYGTTAMVLPLFFMLVFLIFYQNIKVHFSSWLIALFIFLIFSFPFILFFVENYVLGENLLWTDHFFFSTPLCPSTRLSQNGGISLNTVWANSRLLFSGFNDNTPYNLVQGYALLLPFCFLLAFSGFIIIGKRMWKKRQVFIADQKEIILFIFLIWGFSAFILFFLFELNVNRFNHFFIPCIVMSTWMINKIAADFKSSVIRQSIAIMILCFWMIESGLMINNYFTEYPESSIKPHFNANLREAFAPLKDLSCKQIFITDQIALPYVYTLFYVQYPPEKFQREAEFIVAGGQYRVKRFGKYIFDRALVDSMNDYAYLLRKEEVRNDLPNKKILYQDKFWEAAFIDR